MRFWKKFSPARPASEPLPRASRFRPLLSPLEDRTVPAADLFADATVLTGPFATGTGDNVSATAESGEPLDAASGTVNSVWWEWTATEAGPVEVNTFGSDFDTLLGVYAGDSLGNLTLVGSNDDDD